MSGSNICNSTSKDLKEINDLNNTLMSLSVLMDGLLNLNLHNGEQKDIHYFLHRLIVVKVNSMARHVESQIKGKQNHVQP